MDKQLATLNTPQREGVTMTEGPCMVIAGAGSGKTKVLTCRIAYLLEEKNVDPFQVLALTFTNKAAKEMRERVEKMIGPKVRDVWVGTFHSIFARILRIEAERLGFPVNFSIYDRDDSKSLVKTILKDLALDDKIYKPSLVLNRISGAKNRLITAKKYVGNPIYQSDDMNAGKPRMSEIYLQYEERCFKAGAMDFDDLLLNTYKLFNQDMEVLQKYQDKFKYILVDEFQDTNALQYAIIKDLALVHQNICVVGDDAQSIYAFRGANIDNMLSFERDYPNIKVIRLEQNYRSTKNIVNAANSVINHNLKQLKKKVWTENEAGELLHLNHMMSDIDESRFVAQSIFKTSRVNKLNYSHFVVLYRTNSQSRAIEESLRQNDIPYRLIGGVSFYQRKEVKDLLSYLRFLVNSQDEEALKRIINLPKRGIGLGSIDKMRLLASDHGCSVWEIMLNAEHFLKGALLRSVKEFTQMIQAVALDLNEKDAYTVAHEMAKKSGLMKLLYEERTVEGLSRYENLQELLNAIKVYVSDPDQEDKSLAAFLQTVALSTSADESEDHLHKVTLMTIHAAKGLEFDYVYVVGMEEGNFPSHMMVSSREDLEEERRLFYVAITRAKKQVFLSHAYKKYRFGKLVDCEPSRFLNELDAAYIYREKPRQKKVPILSSPNKAVEKNYLKQLIGKRQVSSFSPPANSVTATFKADDVSGLAEGMYVLHPKFGKGLVVKITKGQGLHKACIKFNHVGEKTLLLAFAKLQIIKK